VHCLLLALEGHICLCCMFVECGRGLCSEICHVQIDCSCDCVAVLSSDSLFVARLAKRLFWAYPLCVEVIIPNVRHCYYASWMKRQRLIHIWLPSGFCSQSSMSHCYRPHRAMRSRAFLRSCWVVYGFCARVEIS
jgi:hypothetical protein